MINLDEELGLEYLTENREELAGVESGLLMSVRRGGTEIDAELLDRAVRAVHAVRAAGFFNLPAIRDLAHRTEQLLELIRSGRMTPTPRRTRVLLRAVGGLVEMIRNPSANGQSAGKDALDAVAGVCADFNASALTPHPAIDRPEPSSERLRILLVEDDFASRLLLQTFLSRYGECHVAVNGKEAVAAFRAALDQKHRYDLICMDIMMPEMDGREAVRQVRAMEEAAGILSTAGARIFMTTAVDDIKEVAKCFSELCDAYILKPIDLGQLLSRMKSFHLVKG